MTENKTLKLHRLGSALNLPVIPYLPLVLLFFAGASVPYLAAEIWYDEAYTILMFCLRGYRHILGEYAPNNHILFSLALRAWIDFNYAFIGGAVWSLRLLPLGFALVAVFVTYRASLTAFGSKAPAVFAAALLAGSHVFLSFSCQLRGYSASFAVIALALFAAVRYMAGHSRAALGALMFTGFVAVGILPTNILPVAAVCGWSVYEVAMHSREHRLHIPLLLLTPLLGLAVYLPVMEDVIREAGKNWGWGSHTRVIAHLAAADLLSWCAPVIALMVMSIPRRKRSTSSSETQDHKPGGSLPRLWPLVLAGLGFPAAGILLLRHAPYPRNLVAFVPIWAFLTAAWGNRALARKQNRLAAFKVLILLQLLFAAAFQLIYFEYSRDQRLLAGKPQDLICQYYNSPSFRPQAAIESARSLSARYQTPWVVTDDSDLFALAFYAQTGGLQNLKSSEGLKASETGVQPARMLFITRSPGRVAKMLEDAGLKFSDGEIKEVANEGYFRLYLFESRESGRN